MQDKNFLFTVISYLIVLVVFVNLKTLESSVIGFIALAIYSAINSVLLGNSFLRNESAFLTLIFGFFLLIILLGLIGWLAILVYNLDIAPFSLVLAIAATFSSLTNRRMRH